MGLGLGDDGFQSESGYIPGRTEGEWTWTIRSGSSTMEARVELTFSDDMSTGLQFFQARSLIGQPSATWGSSYSAPTIL